LEKKIASLKEEFEKKVVKARTNSAAHIAELSKTKDESLGSIKEQIDSQDKGITKVSENHAMLCIKMQKKTTERDSAKEAHEIAKMLYDTFKTSPEDGVLTRVESAFDTLQIMNNLPIHGAIILFLFFINAAANMEFIDRGWLGHELLWHQLTTTIFGKEGGMSLKVIADGHDNDLKWTRLPRDSAKELFYT
jgi:hypothetical protein